MSSRTQIENFEVDTRQGIVQIPKTKLTALHELENIALELANGDDPIGDGTADVERFTYILDPEHWVELFPPTVVKDYRDINGQPIPGKDYDGRMEMIFQRYLNPVALAFGRFVKEIPCELLVDGEWSRMYQTLDLWAWRKMRDVLKRWPELHHLFFYACDPLEPAKDIKVASEANKSATDDPTTLN